MTELLHTRNALSGVTERAPSLAYEGLENLLMYSLPLFGYALVARQSWRSRGMWAACLFPLIGYLLLRRPGYGNELGHALLAYCYYLGMSVLVYRIEHAVANSRLTKDALFVLLFLLHVALPTILFRPLGLVPLLVIGWHLVFSSYSYCVDAARDPTKRSFADFLFFLFVDPTLVFPERAYKNTTRPRRVVTSARLLSGLVFMLLGSIALKVFPAIAPWIALGSSSLAQYGTTLVRGILGFLAVYWFRSGVVATRISVLRLLGYQVSECYIRPYLAANPLDFWRRWNLYVGRWARRYLFAPSALYLARLQRRRISAAPKMMPTVGAILATFVLIGILHDALVFAGQSKTSLRYATMFSVASLALLAWEGMRILNMKMPLQKRWIHPVVSKTLSHLYMIHYVTMMMLILDVI